jgi:glycosyltransferase involved in cell wall biosynthesis
MIGTLPPLKGNAYYCMSLASEMSRKINVDFIAFKRLYPNFLYPGGTNETDQNFKIAESETLSIRRIITYYNPISWIRASMGARAQVVHIQWWSIPTAPIYLAILLVLRFRKKKVVFTVHNVVPHEPSLIDRFLTRAVFYFGDAFIVHSRSNRDDLLRYHGLPGEAVYKVHMPVHDMYEGNDKNGKEIRNELRIPSDARVILSFGNLREYKGIDCLIMALSIVVREIPNVHLLIVGQPWTNWDRYKKMIIDLDLRESISTVLEYVPMSSVKNYFSAADLVVLPYKRFDAQSGVGNIALAFGLPLVVTRVGGLPDLVKDERAVVTPDDVSSLARAITKILRDDQLYDKLCNDAEILKRQYSWPAAIESTLAVYRQVAQVNS